LIFKGRNRDGDNIDREGRRGKELRITNEESGKGNSHILFSYRKGERMNKSILLKAYLAISAYIFFSVATFHLLRILFKWRIVVGSFDVPFLLSFAGLPGSIVLTILALWLFKKCRKPEIDSVK
jgi:hypothetical protein